MPNLPSERQVISIGLPEKLYKRLDQALPAYGDKSRVVRALLEKFLDGEITITISAQGAKNNANNTMQLVSG